MSAVNFAYFYQNNYFMSHITESNVTIMVKDMDASISFYEQVGLTLKQRWDSHYAMMTAKGITIGLHPAEDTNNSSGTVSVGFMVDSINVVKALLDANDIPFDEDDGKSGHYLHFKDPDNTILYFLEPKWK